MWLMSNGTKIKLPCATSLSYEVEPAYTAVTSLEGIRRVHVYKRANPLRSWAVTSTRADEKAALMEALPFLVPGDEYGFVPTGAEKMNLLTPGASLLNSNLSYQARIGSVSPAGDYYPGGVTAQTGDPRYGVMTPFPYAGEKVTVSAVSDGAAYLWVEWNTATGRMVRRDVLSLTAGSRGRQSKVLTAPDTATHFTLIVRGNVSAPCMTLGETLYPFHVGQTAKAVVVTAGKNELLGAWATPITAHTLTITEIGEYV